MRRKILVYQTIVLKHVICQRDITMDLHGNSVMVLVCLEEECCNHGSQSTPESLVVSHCVTTVTTVTVFTMVTMCNTGSEGCVSDNGMISVSGHTLLLLDTEGLGDVDKVRTPPY